MQLVSIRSSCLSWLILLGMCVCACVCVCVCVCVFVCVFVCCVCIRLDPLHALLLSACANAQEMKEAEWKEKQLPAVTGTEVRGE